MIGLLVKVIALEMTSYFLKKQIFFRDAGVVGGSNFVCRVTRVEQVLPGIDQSDV